MASVRLQGITKQYENNLVIKGIDLDIADGEFVVLVGPSGCGKSTLLRIVAGLEDVSSGTVEIGGRDCTGVEPARRGIAMVFQSYALYPHMTVAENMGFALKLAKVPRDEIAERVARAAEILQIGHLLERRPKALSGGQRQRVAIGRAIVRKPEVFLFDEPLSNLDAALRGQTRVELARLHRELGATMIYVTHDQVEAMTLGQKIVVFNGGRIEQAGTPLELYERPANQFVAGFLGSPRMNFLPGALAGEEGATAHVRLAGGAVVHVAADAAHAAPGSAVTLGVRPEHLRVEREGSAGIPATVTLVEYLGDSTIVYAQVEGVPEMVSLKCRPDAPCPKNGERVTLAFDPAHGHLFDADGAALPRAPLPR
ncbi:sn-glycerol-3-phosphate ABC transporter ATP-binding protein UgpC [Massilia sp. IC2-477]|uniref:ABC transporter ATP-binding protein n=1 Tax=unclassified Massilia TaxID=2609279 RepID=UPI001D10B804|nr:MULTISPECIES: sn-glycerol-3-phosphate ABC transporter ATP-binding protein UgpC [unclassified Massilia]MCC2957483.1 sn-glycerol-3-phosphate ABC transporter ATP-binding protein UgpC [Massilia sp. IC2-477]MCC2973825.1 sn-glycerol-3-phosphate ABC transporter ATP-binding protein UgpC [Massilia sp. IC2-476]